MARLKKNVKRLCGCVEALPKNLQKHTLMRERWIFENTLCQAHTKAFVKEVGSPFLGVYYRNRFFYLGSERRQEARDAKVA